MKNSTGSVTRRQMLGGALGAAAALGASASQAASPRGGLMASGSSSESASSARAGTYYMVYRLKEEGIEPVVAAATVKCCQDGRPRFRAAILQLHGETRLLHPGGHRLQGRRPFGLCSDAHPRRPRPGRDAADRRRAQDRPPFPGEGAAAGRDVPRPAGPLGRRLGRRADDDLLRGDSPGPGAGRCEVRRPGRRRRPPSAPAAGPTCPSSCRRFWTCWRNAADKASATASCGIRQGQWLPAACPPLVDRTVIAAPRPWFAAASYRGRIEPEPIGVGELNDAVFHADCQWSKVHRGAEAAKSRKRGEQRSQAAKGRVTRYSSPCLGKELVSISATSSPLLVLRLPGLDRDGDVAANRVYAQSDSQMIVL